jgi:hypothetical protein
MRFGTICLFIPFLTLECLAAMPSGMSPACQKHWESYSTFSSPKAFAVGEKSHCGWRAEGTRGTLEEAKRRALETCSRNAGKACRIVDAQ